MSAPNFRTGPELGILPFRGLDNLLSVCNSNEGDFSSGKRQDTEVKTWLIRILWILLPVMASAL